MLISKNQRGVTLIELVITVFILGIISIAMSPLFSTLMASQKLAYLEKQKLINQQLTSSLVNYAKGTAKGFLPDPITGSSLKNAIYDPSDSSTEGLALTATINQAMLNPNEINSDGYASKRARVYQMVSGLSHSTPLYFQSGPIVTLTYQYGVVYQTNCYMSDATCYPTPASNIPGESVKMTSSNYSSWNVAANDIAPSFVSSLPLQKQMLIATSTKLDKIRDAFVSYLVSQQRQAAATDTTNWYPTSSTSLGGATPGSNQGCRDGWYNLNTSTVILPTVGMTAQEFGTTSWGGSIEYCRDYDPTGSSGANAPPHYGALRVNKSMSNGSAPDASVAANNIILTF